MRNSNFEASNSKQIPSSNNVNSKWYDLEDRTRLFALSIIVFCKRLPKSIAHQEITKQVIRSAGSVGANYIEANESLGKKDFLMRIRICRKEAKETRYWLSLTEVHDTGVQITRTKLTQESTELIKIFSAILTKSQYTPWLNIEFWIFGFVCDLWFEIWILCNNVWNLDFVICNILATLC